MIQFYRISKSRAGVHVLYAFLLLCLLPDTVLAQLALPLSLDKENLQLRFEVDSTWHMIHGTVKQAEGRIWRDEAPSEASSLNLEAAFSVASFDTDNGSRDERLREVMKAPAHPTVQVKLRATGDPCTLQSFALGARCSQEFSGTLSIAGTSKAIALPVLFTRATAGQLQAEGSYAIAWAEYGVEDPSILIARLNPTVTVYFSVKAPYGGN